LVYFVWSIVLRVLISLNIALTGVISSKAQCLVYLSLIMISCFLQITTKFFNSWFKQISNYILDLTLLVLATITLIEEFSTATLERQVFFGTFTIYFFTAVQFIIMVICLFETFYDIVSYVRRRFKKRKNRVTNIDMEEITRRDDEAEERKVRGSEARTSAAFTDD
jgi:cation transport ATPase